MLKYIVIICLFICGSLPIQYVPFKSFSWTYPANHIDLGQIAGGSSVLIVMNCQSGSFYFSSGPNLGDLTRLGTSSPLYYQTYRFSMTTPASTTKRYWVTVNPDYPYEEFMVQVIINSGTPIVYRFALFGIFPKFPINLVRVNSACQLNVAYTGQPLGSIKIYNFLTDSPLVTESNSQFLFSIPAAGNYYFVIEQQQLSPTDLSGYTLTLTTACNSVCTDPSTPTDTSTCYFPSCGNSKLDENEECDNGNNTGCKDCVIAPGYQCNGGLLESSVCIKLRICGDGYLDQGEQCDNRNQLGCNNCFIAPGYVCEGSLGGSSVCNKAKVCGDGVLDQGEECDNGGNLGCTNCIVIKGYYCQGFIGSTSICKKEPSCGDEILDQGEQCDNGNKPGCSSGCKVDFGFNCVGAVGSPSVCGFCGNGIVEPGEECDNKNSLGCSVNCKVDAGFSCRGITPSICFRNNPVCGNGLSEVGEACDDGNKLTGDGCGSTCLIEQGYTCTGEPSKCSKKPADSTVCGNGKFQPNNEQCDNGNKDGCLKCVVQSGWSCASQVGLPSVCSPKVVAPHCGNGIFEPELEEICDDGNINNGDGCNYFCQVEFGWVCIDKKKCINTQDPAQVKVFCGNGKTERTYGELCDDGNTLSGDGCSKDCKIEIGWECRTFYSSLQNRSYCSKSENSENWYCGNGIVEGKEQCDDGFPLRNEDGCSISCRVEPGWSCGNIAYSQVTKCWRI